MMDNIVSCCGVICSDCHYYPSDCSGCPAIEGKPFWVQYIGEDICPIYDCCVKTKELEHCGKCNELPCFRFEQEDPTISKEENEANFRSQMKVLKERREHE